jgi:hypothetical protein
LQIKAKPTANGRNCNIPFVDSGKEYFHCTSSNECLTKSGKAKCTQGKKTIFYAVVILLKKYQLKTELISNTKGKFVSAKTYLSTGIISSITGHSLKSVFLLPKIALVQTEPQSKNNYYYELDYWIYMVCVDGEKSCLESGDSIGIYINGNELATHDYDTIWLQRVWLNHVAKFKTNETSITVLIIFYYYYYFTT